MLDYGEAYTKAFLLPQPKCPDKNISAGVMESELPGGCVEEDERDTETEKEKETEIEDTNFKDDNNCNENFNSRDRDRDVVESSAPDVEVDRIVDSTSAIELVESISVSVSVSADVGSIQ